MTLPSSPDENGLQFKSLVALAVVLLHLLFYQLLSHGQGGSFAGHSPTAVLRVEFIERQPRPVVVTPVLPELRPTPAAPGARTHAGSGKPVHEGRETPAPPATGVDIPEPEPASRGEPLVLDWKGGADAGPEFPLGIPDGQVTDPLAVGEPDRFRMRRQLSGKDVVEGTAQLLGLWPEGYTTNPCPRIERNIGGLMTDTRRAGRAALDEELRRQRASCRQ